MELAGAALREIGEIHLLLESPWFFQIPDSYTKLREFRKARRKIRQVCDGYDHKWAAISGIVVQGVNNVLHSVDRETMDGLAHTAWVFRAVVDFGVQQTRLFVALQELRQVCFLVENSDVGEAYRAHSPGVHSIWRRAAELGIDLLGALVGVLYEMFELWMCLLDIGEAARFEESSREWARDFAAVNLTVASVGVKTLWRDGESVETMSARAVSFVRNQCGRWHGSANWEAMRQKVDEGVRKA